MVGVRIEKGVSPWQIFQQKNGFARVKIEGTFERVHDPKKEEIALAEPEIYAMVSKEETGEPVIWWTKCSINGENWDIELDIPVGGPYTLHTSMTECEKSGWSEWGTRGDIVQHIGVGELFVIAGQSNSSGYGKDFIYDPPELGVHIYKNNKSWTLAAHPLQDSTGAENNPNRDAGNTGHSLYLSFAKYLKRELGCPIGLIQASQGGSALAAWNPFEEGALYRNMIEQINECGGSVRAVIWYQGCSDTVNEQRADTYFERFSKMRERLCADLGEEDIPIAAFQISYCNEELQNDRNWAVVREQIRRLGRELKNVYAMPASDVVFSDHIHVSALSNLRLGERAAKVLLGHLFGRNYMCDAPDIDSARFIDAKTVEASFKNVYERLEVRISPEFLAIAAEDGEGILKASEYEIKEGNKIILKFERPLGEGAVLHGGFSKRVKDVLPFDFATHLPILAFYGVKIEK